MSSLEANSFSPKQVTSTKPISSLISSDTTQNQPKRIQPLMKPDHPSPPTIFHLKNLHKSPPPSIQADIGKQRPRQQEIVRGIAPSIQNTLSHLPPQHKLILPGPADPPNSMGNAESQARQAALASSGTTTSIPAPSMASTSAMTQPHITGAVTTSAPVRQLLPSTPGNNGSISAAMQQIAPSPQPMASIIKATGQPAEARLVTASVNPPFTSSGTSAPRVVSTSTTKTITGAVRSDHNSIGRLTTTPIAGQHTAVIQTPGAMRTHQQPAIVRPGTPPINRPHQISHTHRSAGLLSPAIAPVGPTAGQNPTTVQITIHQPKHTVSTPSDRNTAANQPRPISHAGQALTAVSSHNPQVLQKLVISQSSSTGVIQPNIHKTSVPIAPIDQHRSHMARKPIRQPMTGQHDYTRPDMFNRGEMRKPPLVSAADSHGRPPMAIHAVPSDNNSQMYHSSQQQAQFSGFYTPASGSQSLNYQTRNQYPSGHAVASVAVAPQTSNRQPAIISTKLPPTTEAVGSPSGGDNPSGSSTMSSPRPSILRKRPIDRVDGAVVMRKVLQPADLSMKHQGESSAQARIAAASGVVSTTGDNASQSSTDTAMSSESPTQIKSEPMDTTAQENNCLPSTEPTSTDVTPRKKPRKQQLNTVSELKEQHDSSTEEETETKQNWQHLPDLPDMKTSPIRDEFVDKEGVRWVKMRERQQDPLLCFYNITWKSRHNHFQKHSEIKAKEERRPIVSEMASQRGILQRASGWRFYHLSDQFQDMIKTENTLLERMNSLQNTLSPKLRQSNPEANKVYELAQANKQRCSLIRDQLQEAKSSMISILDTHKSKIFEIIHKHHSKRAVKKKDRS